MCGVLDLHKLFGKKWTYALLYNIDKPISFNELDKLSNREINPTLLSARLKELVEYNILEKTQVKNRVYYSITEEGKKIKKLLHEMKLSAIRLGCKVPENCKLTDCSGCREFRKALQTPIPL